MLTLVKIHPNTGHGGNNALVSAAALVNALQSRLDAHPSGLSASDLSAAFAETQAGRKDLITKLMKASNKQHDRETIKSTFGGIMMSLLLPFANLEARLDPPARAFRGVDHVNALPIPKDKPRYIPFDDETPSKRLSGSLLYRLIVAAVLGFLVYNATLSLRAPTGLPEFFRVDEPYKTFNFGIPFLDFMMPIFVRVFAPLVTGYPDPVYFLQIVYFLPMLIPVLTIWTAESYRRGNRKSFSGMLVSLYVVVPLPHAGSHLRCS